MHVSNESDSVVVIVLTGFVLQTATQIKYIEKISTITVVEGRI